MSKKSKATAGRSSGSKRHPASADRKKTKNKKKKVNDKTIGRPTSSTVSSHRPSEPVAISDIDTKFEAHVREANLLRDLLNDLHTRTAAVRAELESYGVEARQVSAASEREFVLTAQELEDLHLRLEESRRQARQELTASHEELTFAAQELEALHLRLEESRHQVRQELTASHEELSRAAHELETVRLRFEASTVRARQDLASAVRELKSAEEDLRSTIDQSDSIQNPDVTVAPTEDQPVDPGERRLPAIAVNGAEAGSGAQANDDGRSIRPLRRVASGGAILWGGTVAFGASTAVLLAILSRHHSVSFAALSALLGLSFVMALVPSGVQLRAAALVADGFAVPRISARFLATVTAVGFALSPIIGLILRVPAVAVALITIQLVVALPLASRSGALIGVHRFEALGVNMVIESAARVGLGALGGLTLGIPGLAGGLALATIVALIALPSVPPDSNAVERPTTSLFNASVTLVLLGFFVQMDVLMAPSGLTHAGATYYDLAALPSKGVYIVLLAAGPMVFPFVRRNASAKLILLAASGTLLFGLMVTAVLLPLRHVIGIVLNQATPSLLLMAVLGSAMAAAGTSAVLLNAGVARGVARPWPPLALGMIAITVSWASHPSAITFALTVLGAQTGTMLLCACVTTMGRRRAVDQNTRTLTDSGLASSLPESLDDQIVSLDQSSAAGIAEPDIPQPEEVASLHRHDLSRSLTDHQFRKGERERDHRGGRRRSETA